MGEITVTGPQAGERSTTRWSGNLSALAVGRARYTMICDADGGILDDLIVYRLGEQEFMVVANASNAAGRAGRARRARRPASTRAVRDDRRRVRADRRPGPGGRRAS